MAANAPYYQMPSGQFIASTNATPSHFVSEDDQYDLSAAAAALPHEVHPASYSESTVCQIPADAPMTSTEENHNLAELLQAATTAAGQAAQAMDAHDDISSSAVIQGKGKRRRVSSSPAYDAAEAPRASDDIVTKRQRVDVPTDPQLQPAEHDARDKAQSTSVPPSSEFLLNDTRAAGVHSAAALFRRSSDKTSRKYTRPPMSKLFMSLQLSPENFLQLQAQAKAYMLDTTYPERQNCVGNRGKGDTDMVKLRLFNCVRNFLDDGVGEHFFGENVEKPGERDTMEAARALGEDKAPAARERLMWPRDGNKIISLVTPLMRRMVTNERQRMYAIETRKGGAKKKGKEGSAEAVPQHTSQSPSGHSVRGQSVEQHLQPLFDPSLAQASHTSQPALPPTSSPITPTQAPVAHMTRSVPPMEVDMAADRMNMPLPTSPPTEPALSNINIFLVLAPHTLPNGTIKPGVKLDEKRIFPDSLRSLTNYPWTDFLREVVALLKNATHRYPAVREHLVPQAHHLHLPASVIPTDNLRELAAAANAMQGDGVVADGDLLPRYAVKTVGSGGWETVETGDEWDGMLERRGREVWADGVISVVVELVDVVGE
jgi:hypothetical protein